MEAIRAAARRHPLRVDGAFAVLLALIGLPATIEEGPGVVGWLGYGLVFVPLVWRRRAPRLVFWVVFALLNVASSAPGVVVALPVVVYTVARYRPRRDLWLPAIAVEAALVIVWIVDDQPWTSLISVNAVLVATALLGMNISTRRAYLEALEERARRLERERDQQAELAAAAERTRIAREMHDIVAHNLTVIVALADAAALTASATPQGAADKMEKVAATGREALGEMRRLLGLLPSPSALVPQPGLEDIDRLIDQVRAAGTRVSLTRKGEPGSWGPGAGLTVYRIVQEALTNTMKHAGPDATAHVRLSFTPGGVEVEVTDDGPRRPPPVPAAGRGLSGMAERAASYGGTVDAGPLPGAGWRVRTQLSFGDGT
jgi:signal transduction histidine kinase